MEVESVDSTKAAKTCEGSYLDREAMKKYSYRPAAEEEKKQMHFRKTYRMLHVVISTIDSGQKTLENTSIQFVQGWIRSPR